MDSPFLKRDDYTVGWMCALPIEMTAARAMLDEIHPSHSPPLSDHNTYVLGRIGKHNIVIACLPKGETGNNSAATVATRMASTFSSIRFGLMVGIGGGVPSKTHDIRLGDVVVSTPSGQHGGVVQWDFGKTTKGGRFERTGTLNRPPAVLMTALSTLDSAHYLEESQIPKYLEEMKNKYPKLAPKYTRQVSMSDILFKADCEHVDTNDTCDSCDTSKTVSRTVRDGVAIHYGLIASGNQVMKDGIKRDEISKDLGGVLCFEMEAAGLMNEFPCVVIRGICDYADSHKIKLWQEYAAATAAAYAKELLTTISSSQVVDTRTVGDVISKGVSQAVSKASESTP
jgi:nucleoside phosphorylase